MPACSLTRQPSRAHVCSFCVSQCASQVRNHHFFEGVDWEAAARRRLKVPFVPPLSGPGDTAHFDSYDAAPLSLSLSHTHTLTNTRTRAPSLCLFHALLLPHSQLTHRLAPPSVCTGIAMKRLAQTAASLTQLLPVSPCSRPPALQSLIASCSLVRTALLKVLPAVLLRYTYKTLHTSRRWLPYPSVLAMNSSQPSDTTTLRKAPCLHHDESSLWPPAGSTTW